MNKSNYLVYLSFKKTAIFIKKNKLKVILNVAHKFCKKIYMIKSYFQFVYFNVITV